MTRPDRPDHPAFGRLRRGLGRAPRGGTAAGPPPGRAERATASPDPSSTAPCGMPVETGRWSRHCTDEKRRLQPFEERLGRRVARQQRRRPERPRADAEAATPAHPDTMPALRDHPRGGRPEPTGRSTAPDGAVT